VFDYGVTGDIEEWLYETLIAWIGGVSRIDIVYLWYIQRQRAETGSSGWAANLDKSIEKFLLFTIKSCCTRMMAFVVLVPGFLLRWGTPRVAMMGWI
jgi:hypothetical protein